MRYILLLICLPLAGFSQKKIYTNAKLNSATVYINAVELNHSASAILNAGTNEVVIKNVANQINENTIRISAGAEVSVLSVKFVFDMNKTEGDAVLPLPVKRLKDSLIALNLERIKTNHAIVSDQKTLEMLDNSTKLNSNVSNINALEYTKFLDYYRSKRTDIEVNINALQEKITKLNQAEVNLNEKLQEASADVEQSNSGSLVLQIQSAKTGNIPFEISYLSNNATWEPYYDIKADNIKEPLSLVYKAHIMQSTGINWEKVKLTLSNAVPKHDKQAPLMSSWRLVYGYPQQYVRIKRKHRADILRQEVTTNTIPSMADMESDIKMEEKSLGELTTINTNQLNISFDIEALYDIQSNGKPQSVALKEVKIPVTYKYYSVPRIDKDAFLLVEIANYSKYNLLAGEANIIIEDMYVGTTFIEPNQTTDTMNLSLGRDNKIYIKREKIEDKSATNFLSSYKKQILTYEITVRNGKNQEVNMVLKDQYPLSSDKDMEIELLESDNALINEKGGFLTWMLKLAPNEVKKIRISYSVKYPKDKFLSNL